MISNLKKRWFICKASMKDKKEQNICKHSQTSQIILWLLWANEMILLNWQ